MSCRCTGDFYTFGQKHISAKNFLFPKPWKNKMMSLHGSD